jgi:plasmid stabilization system protein ParE
MQPWMVTLSDSALADIDDILEATLLVFGSIQLQRYSAQFQLAIRELEAGGPDAALLKDRSERSLFSGCCAREWTRQSTSDVEEK